MLKGHTFNEQLFESNMFRLFQNTFANGLNGIIGTWKQGCNMTNTANSIHINDGAMFIQGGVIEVEGGEDITVDTDNSYCRLVFEVDLSKSNSETQFNQGVFKILKRYKQLSKYN